MTFRAQSNPPFALPLSLNTRNISQYCAASLMRASVVAQINEAEKK